MRKAFKASLRPAFLLVVLVLLAGQHAPPLGADSISEKKEQARQVEQQLNSLQSELNRLTSELSRTESRIATLQANIQANQAQLAAAEAEYGRWQGILSERLVTMYKEGGVSAIDVLLECDDFDTFINSYDYMSRIGNHDADTIKATQELMAQIRAKRAELDSAKAEQEAYSRSLQSQRGSIQSKLNEQKAILAGIDAEVASLLSSRYGGGGGGAMGAGTSAPSTASISRWPGPAASPTTGALPAQWAAPTRDATSWPTTARRAWPSPAGPWCSAVEATLACTSSSTATTATSTTTCTCRATGLRGG